MADLTKPAGTAPLEPPPGTDPALAEMAVIGFAVRHPSLFFQVSMVKAEHFGDPLRRDIWSVVVAAVEERGAGSTAGVIAQRLVRAGLMNQTAATKFLVACQDVVRDAPDPELAGTTYADELLDMAMRRTAIEAAGVLREAAVGTPTRADLKEAAQAAVFSILNMEQATASKPLKVVLADEIRAIEAWDLARSQGRADAASLLPPARVIKTGLANFDNLVPLFGTPKWTTIIGARPSTGKTSLMLQIAWDIAVRQKKACGIVCLEDDKEILARKMISMQTGISLEKMMLRTMNPHETRMYLDSARDLLDAPLEIIDTTRADGKIQPKTITDIVAEVRYMRNRLPLEILFVDYIQRIVGRRRKGENREMEVASVSQMLTAVAVEMDLHMVALAQLKRKDKDHKNRRPNMDDLRESGSLEQDAHIVCCIHNWDRLEEQDERNPEKQRAELVVDKNRNGRTGIADVWFYPPRGGVFEDRTKDEEADQAAAAAVRGAGRGRRPPARGAKEDSDDPQFGTLSGIPV